MNSHRRAHLLVQLLPRLPEVMLKALLLRPRSLRRPHLHKPLLRHLLSPLLQRLLNLQRQPLLNLQRQPLLSLQRQPLLSLQR